MRGLSGWREDLRSHQELRLSGRSLESEPLLLEEPLDLLEGVLLGCSQVGHLDVRGGCPLRNVSLCDSAAGQLWLWRLGQREDLSGDVPSGDLGVRVREDLAQLRVLLDGPLVLKEGCEVDQPEEGDGDSGHPRSACGIIWGGFRG